MIDPPAEAPILRVDADAGPFREVPAPDLLGPGIASVAVAFPQVGRGEAGPPLPPGALAPGMERAVPKRRLEFVAGRLAAREALRRAGHAGEIWLERGEDRAPRWPEGWVGSISHSRGLAWAVAAPVGAVRGVGVDLEAVVEPRAEEALTRVALLPEEQTMAAGVELEPRVFKTVVFGAKECLFKCLYPRVRRMFGFQAAELVELDAGGRFRLRLREDLGPGLGPGREWEGRFLVEAPEREAGDGAGPRRILSALAW